MTWEITDIIREDTGMHEKVSRRDFARASVSVVAGAAAVPPFHLTCSPEAERRNILRRGGGRCGGEAPARCPAGTRVRLWRRTLPAASPDNREHIALAHAQVTAPTQTAPEIVRGWRVGTTIPAEDYTDEKHYLNDERFIADHFWLMVDHRAAFRGPATTSCSSSAAVRASIILRD